MRGFIFVVLAGLIAGGCVARDDDPTVVLPGKTTVIEKDSPPKTNIEITVPPSSNTTGGTTGDTQPGTGTVTTG